MENALLLKSAGGEGKLLTQRPMGQEGPRWGTNFPQPEEVSGKKYPSPSISQRGLRSPLSNSGCGRRERRCTCEMC